MPPAFNLSQDQTLEFNLCLAILIAVALIRISEKHLVFRLSFTLSTWYLKFSRKAEASLGCLQLPDTHAYRFVDQFLKNTLFRADEVENYKILFLRVKAFRKILFFVFLLARCLLIGRVENYAEASFSCQVVIKKSFQSRPGFSALTLIASQRGRYFKKPFCFVK